MNRIRPWDDAETLEDFQRRYDQLLDTQQRFWKRACNVSYWLGAAGGIVAGVLLAWAFMGGLR